MLDDLAAVADATNFSGVVAVARGEKSLLRFSRGAADRANGRPNAFGTCFGIASATKGLTALTVASLLETGELHPQTPIRELVRGRLPLVDGAVTVEQLLAHTSGIGDYLDEDKLGDIDDYVMAVPIHELSSPMAYLTALDGHPQRFAPGTAFAYNNGGYVLLSIATEVATGRSFYDLVNERVLRPAGMHDTVFARSDRLPGGAAIGYLADGRSNVLHLPVRGAGDGGAYSTASDLETLWRALFRGHVLPMAVVNRLVEPRNAVASGRRYGLGFWLLPDRPTVLLEGMDAGVSCLTAYDRPSEVIYTLVSNTSSGVWPLAKYLEDALPALASEHMETDGRRPAP